MDRSAVSELRNALDRAADEDFAEHPIIKHMVMFVPGTKVEIFSDEHPPPHFHILHQEVNASFRIDNCELVDGFRPSSRLMKAIKKWHRENLCTFYYTWNRTRPADCQVGKLRLPARCPPEEDKNEG
tara:strand:+ start:41015 stop:41395 length:381 start_codon:yes stop_codon:yes gene_type:complete